MASSRQNKASAPKQSSSGKSGGAANWRRNFERYMALAQNLGPHDDEVTRQSYYQHAEHYLRMMNDAGQG
ncbi:MAG: DUF4167 domain-containing protein [Parvibaculum sp.]|uniref:DUF4167 domain-containing protein n=1 Tax=Parvibaculum sp. TaxID=2024848 RepID=UPI0025D2C2D0|nr:DUF4167 domain-containing protein [Parvibaculum sp.]MCE9648713.1 DUF4167 domain-containing protein [Parvibaculum sp.]